MRLRERPEEVGNFPGSPNMPFPSTNMELLSCDVLADTLNSIISCYFIESMTLEPISLMPRF